MKDAALLIRAGMLVLAIALTSSCGTDPAASLDAHATDLSIRDMAVPDLAAPPDLTPNSDLSRATADLRSCLPYDLVDVVCEPPCPAGTGCAWDGCEPCHP